MVIVPAYIRCSAWTVRKPPADLLPFALADGDQWGAPGSDPPGSLSFCRTRSDATQRRSEATQRSRNGSPPWTPPAWSGSVTGVPCRPDRSSCILAGWTIAYASLVHVVDETGESLYGPRFSSPLFAKGSWTKWAGRDLFRHRRFVTWACQSSRCFSSHPGPIAWVGWCASG